MNKKEEIVRQYNKFAQGNKLETGLDIIGLMVLVYLKNG